MSMSHRSSMLPSNSPIDPNSSYSGSPHADPGDYAHLAWLQSHEQARASFLRPTELHRNTERTTTTPHNVVVHTNTNASIPNQLAAGGIYNHHHNYAQRPPVPHDHQVANHGTTTIMQDPTRSNNPPPTKCGGGREDRRVFRCFEHGCGGRSFSNIENYRRHIREKTTNFQCPLCCVSFTRKSNRDAHVSGGRCKLEALDTWLVDAVSGWENPSQNS